MKDEQKVKETLQKELWDLSQKKGHRYIEYFKTLNHQPWSFECQHWVDCLYEYTQKVWKRDDVNKKFKWWKAGVRLKIKDYIENPGDYF